MDETKDVGTDQPIPRGQEIFDNAWLWLVLGIAVPSVFYIAWALVDLLLVPSA